MRIRIDCVHRDVPRYTGTEYVGPWQLPEPQAPFAPPHEFALVINYMICSDLTLTLSLRKSLLLRQMVTVPPASSYRYYIFIICSGENETTKAPEGHANNGNTLNTNEKLVLVPNSHDHSFLLLPAWN